MITRLLHRVLRPFVELRRGDHGLSRLIGACLAVGAVGAIYAVSMFRQDWLYLLLVVIFVIGNTMAYGPPRP